MRQPVDRARLERFMELLGRAAERETTVYLTGGASALVEGWRDSTLDIDIRIEPESDRLLRAIPEIKERLFLNVELASPIDFIPPADGWPERSRFIARHGRLTFRHFDFYLQALAKIERGHHQDLLDIAEMFRRDLVEPEALLARFEQIAEELYRYPAIDPAGFRRGVEAAIGEAEAPPDPTMR